MRESIEKERAREQIYAKMQSEYDALREEILHSTIENSMEKAYECVFKYETKELFSSVRCQFSLQELQTIMNCETPLKYLYQVWMNNDLNMNELFEDNIRYEMERLRNQRAAE